MTESFENVLTHFEKVTPKTGGWLALSAAHADTHPIYHRGDSAQHRPGGALGRLLDQTIEREEFHRDQLLRARRIRMALEGLVLRRER